MQESAVPILVVQEGQLAGKRWTLNRSEFVVGRGEDCEVVLPDRQVSRRHFRIVRDDDGYSVEDLGSKNGTYVNGAAVRGSVQLQDGDEIQVALSVRLLFVGAEATLPLTQEMLKVAQPGLRLNKSQRQVWVNGAVLEPPLSLSQYRLLEICGSRRARSSRARKSSRRCGRSPMKPVSPNRRSMRWCAACAIGWPRSIGSTSIW